MTDIRCFVPGCTERTVSSVLTFHRLPSSANLLRRLLLLLFEDSETLSEYRPLKYDTAICSAHFALLMSDTDLVHVLVNSMITKKPSQEAVSIAPKCAAFCCCINLYSDVTLFTFPSDSKRFTLWRRVAGWPKKEDCKYLCARHFKGNSFLDVDRRQLKKGASPLYPTRPFNMKYLNYCPLKKPALPPQPEAILGDSDGEGAAKPKIASRKKWSCAAKGCDVSHLSHPDMRKINFPSDPKRLQLWCEVVGYVPQVKYNTSLCTRHFALSQFYDEETRKNFVKMANPVYPTGPLNLNTNDYCPPVLDITVHMEHEGGHDEAASNNSVITVVEGSRTSEIILVTEDIKRCSAAGCPVNSKTHANVKLYDFPETNMRKMLVWLKIAGCPIEKPRRLCERHFDKNLRELIPKYPFGDLDPETHTYKPVFNPIDPKCCVPGCIVTPGDNDLIFHRFPLEKDMFDAWIVKIGSKKLTLYDQKMVFRSFRVCSRHFTPNSYCEQPKDEHSESEMVLKPTAVPSLHLGDGDTAGLVSDDIVADEIELEFQEADDAAVDPLEEDGRCEVIVKCEPTEKRKSEVVVEPPESKRVKVELIEAPRTPIREARSSDADSECRRTGEEGSDSVTLIDNTVTFTLKGIEDDGGESEGEDRVIRDIVNADGDEDWSLGDTHADTSQPHWDIIIVATRMCRIDPAKTKGLKNVSGKVKVALTLFGDILSHSLMEIVNIFGLQFLRNVFSRILGFPLSVTDSMVSDSEDDEEQPEELNDELMKFSTILMTFSRTLYTAISHVTVMPKPSRVRNRLVSSSGAPGMSRKGWVLLMKKRDVIGPSFHISLAVVEVPIRKELSWTGKEVFGYVDLGHGRISDVTTEATAALVFYANSPTHDFLLPIGYCLINNLSPSIRANLINLYLLLIHAIDVRCNAVVCEDSVITHQTYRELGVVQQNGLPSKGYFPHPWLKTELIYCFADVDDALRSVCNLLAENGVFLSEDSKDVRWADVETVHGLPQWDLSEFPVNMTRFQYLRSLQLKLKKDQRVFKKNSSLVLKAIKKHNNSKSGTGSSEFLAKMDVIDNLFSGCNVFCKDSPAVCRENVMISLGRIRNALMYIKGLKDLDGCSLLSGSRRNFQSLALNLVSLEGYLRRILIFERRHSKKAILRTTSLTLRDVRSAVRELSVEMVPAKEFRSAFKAVLKKGRRQNCSVKMAGDEIRPLHVGLNVTESYKYEPLNAGCELAEEYLAKNVVCRWLDETACPDCCFLVSMETAVPSVGPNLSSDVRRLLRAAERCLRRAEEVPLDGESFPRFVCSVLREMADFPGFLSSNHLFDSVEFGRTSHFTIMVNNLLRIFLRYRIGFMSTTTKVIIRPDTRETSFLRSAVLV